jgi:hypothetical protein
VTLLQAFKPLLLSFVLMASACTTTTHLIQHSQSSDFKRDQLDKNFVVAVTNNSPNGSLFEGEIEKAMLSTGLQSSNVLMP